MQVGLGQSDCARWGPSSLTPKRGRVPQFLARVNCGQTAARIKIPLGTHEGLGPYDIVLDGDPAPPPQKGAEPPIFGPCLLWPNGCMDQDATWYGGRPWLRPHCARWVPSSHSLKGGTAFQFSAHVCCGQMSGWIKMPLGAMVGLDPGNIVLDADPAPPPKGHSPLPPNFGPCLLWPYGWMDEDATWYEGRPQRRPHCVT